MIKKKDKLKEKAKEICKRLDERYGTHKVPYLSHSSAFELLIATILSAQCTDARVNMVTPHLFAKYRDVHAFAIADRNELEKDIHSIGFYHNKAKNIIACAKMLESEYGGAVPSDMDSLLKLPGVGRKTANVIRGNIFGEPSIVVDTHVKRVSKRLGLTDSDDPTKAEFELMEVLPKENWIRYNIQVMELGRTICKAPNAKCSECYLSDICDSFEDK